MENNFYGYDSEAFDMSTNGEINKKKKKKNFKIILVISIIILTGFLVWLFIFMYNKINTFTMEPIKKDITASGEYFYGQRSAVIEMQAEIVKNKKTYLILKRKVDNNGYIGETNITVYTDGTYLHDYVESYQGNYRNERTMGYIDLTLINEYIDENKEVLLKMYEYDYENGDDPFVDYLMINIDGKYVYGDENISEQKVYKETLDELFNNSPKEVVQDFDMIEE